MLRDRRTADRQLAGELTDRPRTLGEQYPKSDEGWGVEFTASGKSTLHATGVFFRRGRLVAAAGYVRADETTMREAAVKAFAEATNGADVRQGLAAKARL